MSPFGDHSAVIDMKHHKMCMNSQNDWPHVSSCGDSFESPIIIYQDNVTCIAYELYLSS